MSFAPVEWNSLDQRIWTEELDSFVPQQVFDVHTHCFRWAFNTSPGKDATGLGRLLCGRFEECGWDQLDACDRVLMPGRSVHRLAFGFPFAPDCDFDSSNRFVGDQAGLDPDSAGLMLVHPSMDPEFVENELDRHALVGLKPYRLYSATGDTVDCRITDFLPERLIEIADRRRLLIMMHLSKRDAVADPQNQADLAHLTETYPGAKWILAHCARSYSFWAVERAAALLRKLPNVWFDTSSVCESDAIDALLSTVGSERVMYGSDDLPVGALRGKYIAFGFAWAYLSESNQSLDLSHCDAGMTFTRYEQLRAMQRAARRLGLNDVQIRAMFHDTALTLVRSVRGSNAAVRPNFAETRK